MADVVLGKKSQGGSTITQQYIKNAFGTPEKTIKRKVEEALLANKIEQSYTKDQILELYLNTIYFGHGCLRCGGGLAGLLRQGRGQARPGRVRDAGRRHQVAGPLLPLPGPDCTPSIAATPSWGRCTTQSYITAEQEAAAVAQPVKTAGLKSSAAAAPYFVEWVKDQLVKQYGQDRLYRGGPDRAAPRST